MEESWNRDEGPFQRIILKNQSSKANADDVTLLLQQPRRPPATCTSLLGPLPLSSSSCFNCKPLLSSTLHSKSRSASWFVYACFCHHAHANGVLHREQGRFTSTYFGVRVLNLELTLQLFMCTLKIALSGLITFLLIILGYKFDTHTKNTSPMILIYSLDSESKCG